MRFLITIVILVLSSSLVVGQKTSALQDMVKTEQAFSRTAAEKNTRDAFMEFIADDGLLFRPGAVNGKKWMLEHPVPSSDKKPLLAWQPAFAGMAKAGDLGFTTGPWEFKSDIKDEKPAGYGHFVTLWKKQPDGSWRFVVDLGISHPQSGGPQTLWQPPAVPTKAIHKRVDIESTRQSLILRDKAFSDAGLTQGLVKAFVEFASPDVRLYRSDNLPYIGRAAAEQGLTAAKGNFVWTPIGSDASQSGDLGYTHGTYEATATDATKTVIERGSYVRIWKNEGGWKVIMDVTSPLPK
jgi:ketosteroid isomerase-like protein